MNIFPLFQTILYTISTALLYPVVILLVLLCIWMLGYAGGFLAEWVKRRQYRTGGLLSDSLDLICSEKMLPESVGKTLPVHIKRYAQKLSRVVEEKSGFTEERIEDLVQREEGAFVKEMDKIRLIVRLGPSLGLMGTLIPMGTGLSGLSQGDMAQLSSSLILAFTTTVVGLALGSFAHVFSVVKERWVREDIRHIQLITEAMTRNRGRG